MKRKTDSVPYMAVTDELKNVAKRIEAEIPDEGKWKILSQAFAALSSLCTVCDDLTTHPEKDPDKRELERVFLSTVPEAANEIVDKVIHMFAYMIGISE